MYSQAGIENTGFHTSFANANDEVLKEEMIIPNHKEKKVQAKAATCIRTTYLWYILEDLVSTVSGHSRRDERDEVDVGLTSLLIDMTRLTSQPKLHNLCPALTAKPAGTELPLHGRFTTSLVCGCLVLSLLLSPRELQTELRHSTPNTPFHPVRTL